MNKAEQSLKEMYKGGPAMTTTPKQWGLTPEERHVAELASKTYGGGFDAQSYRIAAKAALRLDDSTRTLRARVAELEAKHAEAVRGLEARVAELRGLLVDWVWEQLECECHLDPQCLVCHTRAALKGKKGEG